MSTEAWIGVGAIGMTASIAGLGFVVAVIGWFLKRHMGTVEGQLATLNTSMAGIRTDLAVLGERLNTHEKRIDRHAQLFDKVMPRGPRRTETK